ncbi:hypothetical protein Tco_0967920 [Tanacetum coccineum]
MTGNMKNASKFLKVKCDFHIANDEGDGEGSNQTTNKTDTFVELKNKHWVNFLVDIKKTIKSNSCENRAKVRLVSKVLWVNNAAFMEQSTFKRFVDFPIMLGKALGSVVHRNVIGGIMMINVDGFRHYNPRK